MKKLLLISLVTFPIGIVSFLLWNKTTQAPVTSPPIESIETIASSTEEIPVQDNDLQVSTTTEVFEIVPDTPVVESGTPEVKNKVPNLSMDSIKTKEDLLMVKEYVDSLPSIEVSNMIYRGDISSELLDVLNININFKEIFNIVAPSKYILKDIGSSNDRTTLGKGMGVNVSISEEDEIEMYVYDSEGRYTGTFPLVSYSDEARGIFYEARGVDLSRFAGYTTFNFSEPTQSTLFFQGKKSIVFPNIEVSMINGEPFSYFMFPMSASTRASITFTADTDNILVGRFNIDFNGDQTTDVSVPISESLSKKDFEKAFDLIIEDTKLPQQDRDMARNGEKTVIEYMFDGDE